MAATVVPVRYQSHDATYRLDVEVFDAVELRSRVESVPDRGYERADFQSFLFVSSGSYTHTVDFEVHDCNAGSCLLIRPGQVHRFGPRSDWDGWILIAGPQHVPDKVADLSQHIRLDGPLASAVTELLDRMASDRPVARGPQPAQWAARPADPSAGQPAGARRRRPGTHPTHRSLRARAVSRLPAQRSSGSSGAGTWSVPTPGISDTHRRPSTGACRAAAAMTPKRVIVERIILEAKRLLAHSQLPVASISDQLGFDETTNFVKYFKRETGTTPDELRSHLRSDKPRRQRVHAQPTGQPKLESTAPTSDKRLPLPSHEPELGPSTATARSSPP